MPGQHEQERNNARDDEIVRDDEPAGREPNERPREIGGPKGPEPTRYGDWQRAGRCIDF